MQTWLRDRWQKLTTKPCDGCLERVPVTAYRKTGRSRKVNLFFGYDVEMECPHCGDTFWARK
jgi:hypothetical protein